MIVKIRKALVDVCSIEGVQCIKRLTSTETGITYDIIAVLKDGRDILLDVIEVDEIDATLEEILRVIKVDVF